MSKEMLKRKVKTIPNFKTLDFYKIPLKLKNFGSNSEILLPFVADVMFSHGPAESVVLPSLDSHKGKTSIYHKTGNFYIYNTNIKQNIFDILGFTTYSFLSATCLRIITFALQTNLVLTKWRTYRARFIFAMRIQAHKIPRGFFFIFSLNQIFSLPIPENLRIYNPLKFLKITRRFASIQHDLPLYFFVFLFKAKLLPHIQKKLLSYPAPSKAEADYSSLDRSLVIREPVSCKIPTGVSEGAPSKELPHRLKNPNKIQMARFTKLEKILVNQKTAVGSFLLTSGTTVLLEKYILWF